MTTEPDPVAPLRQAGFDDTDIEALNRVWRNDGIGRVLGEVAGEVRDWGGTAAEAFDAVQHGLDFEHVITYLVHGFTAHQVHVLLRDPNCWRILEPVDHMDREADFLHRPRVPRQIVVNVLRIARTRDEAKTFLDQYENARDHDDEADDADETEHGHPAAAELAAAFENQVALGDPEPYCGCRRWRQLQ